MSQPPGFLSGVSEARQRSVGPSVRLVCARLCRWVVGGGGEGAGQGPGRAFGRSDGSL